MAVVLFFVLHWQLSVFFQSFFLHRYGAHGQLSMSRGWERFFYVCTWLTQGSSFLVPRAYAVLHRMHHAHADTDRDPHSPLFHKTAFGMMWKTKDHYTALVARTTRPEARFDGGAPHWETLDRFADAWPTRAAFGALYIAFYWHNATAPWMWALLPLHFLMGPLHGAIVNWCGHKYGYRNYASDDVSRNTLPFDVLTMGELFQNNHHRYGMSPNFAARRWEVDPGWLLIRALAALGVVQIETTQRMRWPEPPRVVPATALAAATVVPLPEERPASAP